MTVLNQNKYLWKYSYTEFYFTVQDLYNPAPTPQNTKLYFELLHLFELSHSGSTNKLLKT